MVISSANLHRGHWSSVDAEACGNAVWFADFPRLPRPNFTQFLDKTQFGGNLVDFVARLTLVSHQAGTDSDLEGQSRWQVTTLVLAMRIQSVWQDDLAEFDFSAAPEGIHLVSSVPAYRTEYNKRRLHPDSLGYAS